MKKLGRAIFLAVLVLILAIVILTACNNKGHGQTNDNTQDKKTVVVFIVDGVEYSRVETKGNEIIVMPTNPQKDGYTFVGWFWDKDAWQRPFTANSMLTEPLKSDMSVYAYFERAHEHTIRKNGAMTTHITGTHRRADTTLFRTRKNIRLIQTGYALSAHTKIQVCTALNFAQTRLNLTERIYMARCQTTLMFFRS